MTRLGLKGPKLIYKAVGCDSCNHTGYSGRVGIFELIEVDTDIKMMLEESNNNMELIRLHTAKKGVQFLEDTCRTYVLNGTTSIQEFDSIKSDNIFN